MIVYENTNCAERFFTVRFRRMWLKSPQTTKTFSVMIDYYGLLRDFRCWEKQGFIKIKSIKRDHKYITFSFTEKIILLWDFNDL